MVLASWSIAVGGSIEEARRLKDGARLHARCERSTQQAAWLQGAKELTTTRASWRSGSDDNLEWQRLLGFAFHIGEASDFINPRQAPAEFA